MVRRCILLVAIVASMLSAHVAVAESFNVALPADAKFVVRLDLAALKQSKVGGPLFAQAKAQFLDKVAKKQNGLSEQQIADVVGFDPFEEVQSIVVAGADYQSPEHSLVAVIQLRKTAGNLEGLMLALPNYASIQYGEHQIHSALLDGVQEVHASIYTAEGGAHALVVAAKREAVERILDSLDGKAPAPSPGESSKLASLATGGPVLSLQVFEFPPDMISAEGPAANVAKIVSSMAMQVAEVDGNVKLGMQLAAQTDQQAEQIKQMAQGLIAMVNLAAANKPAGEGVELAQRLLQGAVVERSGAAVSVNLSVPGEEVAKFIEEQIKKND